jgi:hypothetical protein
MWDVGDKDTIDQKLALQNQGHDQDRYTRRLNVTFNPLS